MGVQLTSLIEPKQISFEDLAGKTIAIDAFNTLYQFLSIIRDRMTGEQLKDSEGRITSHLSGLLYRTSKLVGFGIRPVFVFDGEPPAFKAKTVEERKKARKEAEEQWISHLQAGRFEEARKAATRSARLTGEMIGQSKELLGAMGISYVQAKSEGEAQAAYMAKKGTVYASASQDWDSLLFGAPRMLKNLAISGKRKVANKEKYTDVSPELIELEEALKNLGISQDQLIILGILVGTDYNPEGIKGIGPKKALAFVKEFKTLENVVKQVEWPFEITPEEIFDFFKNPPVEEMEIPKAELDPEKLKQIMVSEHGFSEERVAKVIEMLKASNKKEHSGLGRFFG
ncbi:MAG: flap endonuclease-1 [Candidatus Aenigmarchaeota archaeon]|nr:flap endonuclease-1 [Candidatus Aenigmarchaeota archaeon]